MSLEIALTSAAETRQRGKKGICSNKFMGQKKLSCVCWFWQFYYHVWCIPAVRAPEVHKKQTWLLINERPYDLQIRRPDWFYYKGSLSDFTLLKVTFVQPGRHILSLASLISVSLAIMEAAFGLISPLFSFIGISTKASFSLLCCSYSRRTHLGWGRCLLRLIWEAAIYSPSIITIIIIIIYSLQTKQTFLF